MYSSAITPQAESADQPVIHGMFLLSRLWARVLIDYGASHSFIASSVVIELGLEVETLEEPLYVSSLLGIRAKIGMDWLTAYRVVIDCERRRVTAYT